MNKYYRLKAIKTCNRKERYTMKEAERIAIERNRLNYRAGHHYFCNICGGWHITKMSRSKQN